MSDYVVMDVVLGLNVWDTEESLRSVKEILMGD